MVLLFGGKKETWKNKRRGKIITIQLPEELYAEIDAITKKYGISRSQFIRDAVIEKLMRLETQNRNA